MTDSHDTPNSAQSEEPKKISLAEAMKQKLAQKKQNQENAKNQQKPEQSGSNRLMRNQLVKKPNNQRKRTGV